MAETFSEQEGFFRQVWDFPLGEALTGRRARRFAMGMEVPGGPLAFKSQHEPLPLSETEQAILICAATGVTGWHFGVPYSTSSPNAYPSYTLRFSGHTYPTRVGSLQLFYTDDDGIYMTHAADLPPAVSQPSQGTGDLRAITQQLQDTTSKISNKRLELPREAPHLHEHNLWNANFPGSTLLMPVADLSEYFLQILTLSLMNHYQIWDDMAGRLAGNLEPYIRSGMLSTTKQASITSMEYNLSLAANTSTSIMGHNAVLSMQAMGLGGWLYTGINGLSAMGAYADDGVPGMGFRFVRDDRYTGPNPVGLDGQFETMCPPHYPDMRTAARELVTKMFGEGGTYDPKTEGAFARTDEVKGSVVRYSEEFIECLGEVAQYIYDTYGRFPGTIPTMVAGPYVQAQHIDLDFYDTHFQPGAYLETHRQHMAQWHEMA